MGILGDIKTMFSDFVDYFSESKGMTADEFISEFEKREEEKYNSKEETLKRLGLDKIPCKLTSNDFNGVNTSKRTENKYKEFAQYLKMREEFEREWE